MHMLTQHRQCTDLTTQQISIAGSPELRFSRTSIYGHPDDYYGVIKTPKIASLFFHTNDTDFYIKYLKIN